MKPVAARGTVIVVAVGDTFRQAPTQAQAVIEEMRNTALAAESHSIRQPSHAHELDRRSGLPFAFREVGEVHGVCRESRGLPSSAASRCIEVETVDFGNHRDGATPNPESLPACTRPKQHAAATASALKVRRVIMEPSV